MSIRSKLLLIFAVFAFGGPCLVMLVAGWQTRQDSLNDYAASSMAQMERANNYIEAFFATAATNAVYMASMPELRAAQGKLPNYVNSTERIMPERARMSPEAALVDMRLEQISRANSTYDGIGIGLEDGGFLNSPPAARSPGYDPRARGWYKTARASSGKFSFSKLYSASNGSPVCTAMGRIEGPGGKLMGFSYIDIKLDTLTEMLSAIKFGKSGFVVLVEDTGTIVTGGKFKDVAFTSVADGKIPGLEDVLTLAPGSYVREIAGVSRVLTVITGFNNWRFICLMDESEVHEGGNALIMQLALITLGLALVSLFLGITFAKNLSRPILKLAAGAERVAGGDFDADMAVNRVDELGQLSQALASMVAQLKERLGFAQGIMQGIIIPFIVVDSQGQITFMNQQVVDFWGLKGQAADFYGKKSGEFFDGNPNSTTPLDQVLKTQKAMENVPVSRVNGHGQKKYIRVTVSPLWDLDGNILGACMLFTDETEIREQQDRIMALNERITLSVKSAHAISGRQSEAFTRLTGQLDRTAEYAATQEAASGHTVDNVRRMGETLDMLAEKAKETTEDTRATRNEAEQGSEIVSRTVECINRVASYVQRTEKGMQALGEQAAGINNIVELIKDIADQTNLLALNAAIEAARAGESGRGFAVVADEVRKLAEKTMHATEDVNKSVLALQNEVTSNMELTNQTVQLTGESTQLAEESGARLSSIVSIADKAVTEVLAISEAAAEQSQAGASVAEAMSQVSDMARQTSQNMQQSVEFVTELTGLADELKKLIDSMGSDRRRADRYRLDFAYNVSVSGLLPNAVKCRVLDVSVNGMRLEVPGLGNRNLTQGTRVQLVASDPPLAEALGSLEGHLAWQDGAFCGVEFKANLKVSSGDLESLVNRNTSGW